jgi:antitoxin (DNA-binding transcriptional repressor) of toxin-antitoxin stability system
MKATILDLRYKMRNVLNALDRGEIVKILYHGKLKGVIHPHKGGTDKKIEAHPFFGMHKTDRQSVTEMMENLRGSRSDDF